MSGFRRTLTGAVSACAASACLAVTLLGTTPGYAQSWPQRPVKFIVTLGPGSGTDIGMRLLADRLTKRWSHPVVVENRPGGDGIVAITTFLGANDDHVLLGAPVSSFTAHPYVVPNLPYKQSELAPIARGWNLILAELLTQRKSHRLSRLVLVVR